MSKLTELYLKNFTVFKENKVTFSEGINAFIGANGTGKTHILKVLYAACDVKAPAENIYYKLFGVFRPEESVSSGIQQMEESTKYPIGWEGLFGTGLTHLAHRVPPPQKDFSWELKITRCSGGLAPDSIEVPFGDNGHYPSMMYGWHREKMDAVYIPVKEMLAHAPGFVALTEHRELAFEDVYPDIIRRAQLPVLRSLPEELRDLLKLIEDSTSGQVVQKGETFFLKDSLGELEFSLVAEGLRKLALLGVLLRNGSLDSGHFLFWDEPEANLNPSLLGTVADILLTLEQMGVQIFIATHNYVLLKELELRAKPDNKVLFHGITRMDDGDGVQIQSVDQSFKLENNPILDAYLNIYDREVEKMKGSRRNA